MLLAPLLATHDFNYYFGRLQDVAVLYLPKVFAALVLLAALCALVVLGLGLVLFRTFGDAGDAGDCLVPPLLLQPLVENAVTHGIAHLIDGGTVRVVAARAGGWLRIVVDNPCDPDRPKRGGTGVGLANVRARLRALHGADATVVTDERGGRWQVEVTLPATVEAPA